MEHEFHDWLKTQSATRKAQPDILVGIGDDAAVLAASNQSLVVTTDMIAESTHFDLELHSLQAVGRKALAVNLSDLAAMAAKPFAAVLNFLLPKSFGLDQAQELYSGIALLAADFETAIVGGDTNTWNGPLVLGATVMGHRQFNSQDWRIGGVQPGDRIFVSGTFGGSIHGRHLTFLPRVELALYLAERYTIHAATDASDSLSLDLNAMAKSSQLGIQLDLDAIPVSNDVKSRDRQIALKHALHDGEDFELIVAVPAKEVDRLEKDAKIAQDLTQIGVATEAQFGLGRYDHDGNWQPIIPSGYVH